MNARTQIRLFFRRTNLKTMSADMVQLLLCMCLGHAMTGFPLVGAALYLAYLAFHVALDLTRATRGMRNTVLARICAGFALLTGAGAAAILALQDWQDPRAAHCFSLILLVILRTAAFEPFARMRAQRFFLLRSLFFHGAFSLLFWLLCRDALPARTSLLFIVSYFLAGLLLIWRAKSLYETKTVPPDAWRDAARIASYRLYAGMEVCASAATYLSFMLFVCFMCLAAAFSNKIYTFIVGWTALVLATSHAFYLLLKKRGNAWRLSFLISGALCWIAASAMLFKQTSLLGISLWTLPWAFGAAAVNGVSSRMNEDFKLLTRLVSREDSDAFIAANRILLRQIGFLAASALMLLILMLWPIVILPGGNETSLRLRAWMTLLPLLFMGAAVILALLQPLDEQNRQRLLHDYRKFTQQQYSPRLRERTERLFVRKRRSRLGIKLLMGIVRPFLRLKVVGKEHIDPERFPCVFVCNHGFAFGPMAAVLYLPSYFRPWVRDRWLNKDMLISYLLTERFRGSGKVKAWLLRAFAHAMVWCLNSFDPISVGRSDLRTLVKTMEDTVDALLEDDNVLLFPEDPTVNESKRYLSDRIGEFFTGFAQIGRMYWQKTGRRILFYPTCASKKARLFIIGEPVEYDPDASATQEKLRISQTLRNAMLVLEKKA